MYKVNFKVIKEETAVALIELMVVLTIIAVMLGIAAPDFFNYQHTLKLRTAAREAGFGHPYPVNAVSQNTTHQLCVLMVRNIEASSRAAVLNLSVC